MKKHLICDLDGVLWDSESAHYNAFRQIFDGFSISFCIERYKQLAGMSTPESISRILTQCNIEITNDRLNELVKTKRILAAEMLDYCQLNQELILFLRNKNISFSICSGASKKSVKKFLDRAENLLPQVVVTGECVKHSKPSSEPYLRVLNSLDFHRNECVVIEDSDNGLTSARSAGLDNLIYYYGFTNFEQKNANRSCCSCGGQNSLTPVLESFFGCFQSKER